MNTPSFNSTAAPLLYDFVKFKRDSGYKYNGEVKELQRLDKYLITKGITDFKSCDSLDEWLRKRETESFKTFSIRNSVYRQLYNYSYDIANVVIPTPLQAKERMMSSGFVPYIFTHEQIRALFSAVDNDNYTNPSFRICAPLLFRILYGTGLRINEALSLKISDISPSCEMIVVRDGKSENSRLVPLSVSLSAYMKSYLDRNGYSKDQPVFQTTKHTAVRDKTVYEWFRRVLWKAGIPHQGRGKGPRMHDLRHTFAVHSLQQAVERGTDINAFLPILCTYLGHKRLSATERYLRLTAEMFPQVIEASNSVMDRIVPEVKIYEN